MSIPADGSLDRVPSLVQATIRRLDGPSLEDDATVVVVALSGDVELSGTTIGALVEGLGALLRAAAIDLSPAIAGARSAGHIAAAIAEAAIAQALDRQPAGVRQSRLFGALAYVLPDVPSPVLRRAIAIATRMVDVAATEGDAPSMAVAWRRGIEDLRRSAAGPAHRRQESATTVFRQAQAMGLPTRWSQAWPEVPIIGEGRRLTTVISSFPTVTRNFGNGVTADKTWTKTFLERLGLPVVPHRIVPDADAAARAAESLGFPVVLKPLDGANSVGVTVDIRSAAEIPAAFAYAAQSGSGVIVQPYLDLPDFRAFVVDGRVNIVYRRNAPFVVGDGRSTVRQLIATHNQEFAEGRPRFPAVAPVPIDAHLELTIAKAGHALEAVPPSGETVVLRSIPLRANGGYFVEVTQEVHPDNVRMLERALVASRLMVTGLDFRAESVARPWHAQKFGLLELNLRPVLTDFEGERVASYMLRAIFPNVALARMPTIVVVDGEAVSTEALRRVMRERGAVAGVSGPDGLFLDDFVVGRSPMTIADAQARIIDDPTADIAIHVIGAERLAATGLGLRDVACAILPSQHPTPIAHAAAQLVRRWSRRIVAMPPDPLARTEAIVAAAETAIADYPLPPYAGP